MTIWISRELPLFISERLDISSASITHLSQKLCTLEFGESFRVQFRLSRYIRRLNRTSKWKVMTIWISLELPFFSFERVNIYLASIIHPSQKLRSFGFAESFHFQFWVSRYIILLNRTSEWRVTNIWISQELLLFIFERLDISSTSIIHPSQKLWPFEFA